MCKDLCYFTIWLKHCNHKERKLTRCCCYRLGNVRRWLQFHEFIKTIVLEQIFQLNLVLGRCSGQGIANCWCCHRGPSGCAGLDDLCYSDRLPRGGDRRGFCHHYCRPQSWKLIYLIQHEGCGGWWLLVMKKQGNFQKIVKKKTFRLDLAHQFLENTCCQITKWNVVK